MIGDYSDEGLKMIDLKLFNKELQICLGQKKYLDQENHGKWKNFFDSEWQRFGETTIFRGNPKQRGQYQAECDDRRLFRRRSKDDRFKII